jgi:hypothetical protein
LRAFPLVPAETSLTITVTTAGTPAFVEFVVWAFSGVNATVWDDSITVLGGSNVTPITVTTTNAADGLIGCSRNGGTTGSVPSGWTAVGGSVTYAGFTFAQYKFVTIATSYNISDPSPNPVIIGDAVQSQ